MLRDFEAVRQVERAGEWDRRLSLEVERVAAHALAASHPPTGSAVFAGDNVPAAALRFGSECPASGAHVKQSIAAGQDRVDRAHDAGGVRDSAIVEMTE
jgi:hypothetical protein